MSKVLVTEVSSVIISSIICVKEKVRAHVGRRKSGIGVRLCYYFEQVPSDGFVESLSEINPAIFARELNTTLRDSGNSAASMLS